MTSPADTLFGYMEARQAILLRRKAGNPGPWTDDPILGNWRFCNVYREDDTVTIWVRKNIREKHFDSPYLYLALAVARYINWPDTLEELMLTPGAFPTHPDFHPTKMTAALEARASRGDKVYTGAYMIRAESNPKAEWYSWSKHRYIAEIVIGRIWEDHEDWNAFLGVPGRKLEEVWNKFQDKRYIGWGPFMAYEVVTDMRHTHYLRHSLDIMSWANAGPGAIRGLNRLHGRELTANPGPNQTNVEMRELLVELNQMARNHASLFPPSDYWGVPFEMRDVEHNLCELDKYLRLKRGEGKPRSRYSWRTATVLTD